MKSQTIRLLALLGAFALVLAACDIDGGGDTTTSEAATETTAAPDTTEASGGADHVRRRWSKRRSLREHHRVRVLHRRADHGEGR